MQTLTRSQLKQWIDDKKDMILIDVLPEDSFRNQHIPGAVNIPLKDTPDFAKAVEQQGASRDSCVVVYCKNLQCDMSRQAVQKLTDAGFANVYAFEEGVEGWFGKSQAAA